MGRDRGDEQDVAAPAGAHGRQQGPGDAHGAEHVDVVHALPVVQIRLGGGLDAQRAAGDVDDRVQGATEQLVHALDQACDRVVVGDVEDRKSTRLNSSHVAISYAVFCLKKKKDEI